MLDPNSEESRLFRLRFRIPYGMFELLLLWVTDWLQNEIHLKTSDCTGRQVVPTSLKLLKATSRPPNPNAVVFKVV